MKRTVMQESISHSKQMLTLKTVLDKDRGHTDRVTALPRPDIDL